MLQFYKVNSFIVSNSPIAHNNTSDKDRRGKRHKSKSERGRGLAQYDDATSDDADLELRAH